MISCIRYPFQSKQGFVRLASSSWVLANPEILHVSQYSQLLHGRVESWSTRLDRMRRSILALACQRWSYHLWVQLLDWKLQIALKVKVRARPQLKLQYAVAASITQWQLEFRRVIQLWAFPISELLSKLLFGVSGLTEFHFVSRFQPHSLAQVLLLASLLQFSLIASVLLQSRRPLSVLQSHLSHSISIQSLLSDLIRMKTALPI
jgi:hypothetical protein